MVHRQSGGTFCYWLLKASIGGGGEKKKKKKVKIYNLEFSPVEIIICTERSGEDSQKDEQFPARN